MKTHSDVKAEIDNNIELISLEKLVGKKIKEVQGHIRDEFGYLTFQLYRICFEDGESVFIEGEHDCPYIPDLPIKELESIYKTNPDYDGSYEDGEDE